MLIGEVSERSGISARMLRHYDRIGLVSPSGRTSGGYREYSEEDVRRLFHVEGLRSLGLGLHEVADVLGDLGFDPAPLVEQLVARTRRRIAEEQELLRRLVRVRSAAPADWADALRTIGLVRGMESVDPSSRQRLALALGGTGGAAALAEAALEEPDVNAAGAIHWALTRAGDDAIGILARALRSPQAERRHRATTALEKIGTPAARAALAEGGRSADPLLQVRAAVVRAQDGDATTIPTLVGFVADGPDDVVAADALALLTVEHGAADAVVAALRAALAAAPAEARRRLIAALAEIPGPAADALLEECLDDPDRGAALTAAALRRSRP